MGGGGLFPEAAEALPVWDEGSHSLRGAQAAALPGNTPLSSPSRLALVVDSEQQSRCLRGKETAPDI